MKKLPDAKRIAIFGGGRWSKVLLEILLKSTKPGIQFTVHTKHLVKEMSQWSKKNNYLDRMKIYATDPKLKDNQYLGVIIANSAKNHKEKAMLAIKNRIPVLIEKPMTPSFIETKELIDLAKNLDTQLFSSWVFKYAKYIDNFIEHIKKYKPLKEIHIIWSDPIKENRYGEVKFFDQATPLFEDVLPHVLSILSKVSNCEDFKFQKCFINRGGASIDILLLSGDIKCNLRIERNASERIRKILINSRKDIYLDFSNEPGIIKIEDKEYLGDLEWNNSIRPLSRMIVDFLDAIDLKKNSNKNLDNNLALIVSKLNDEVKIAYDQHLYRWFLDIVSTKEKSISIDDLMYFISEVIYKNLTLPYKDKDQMISKIMDIYQTDSFQESFNGFNPNNLIEDVNKKIFSICVK